MNATQTGPTLLVNGDPHPLPREGTTLAQFLETMDIDAQTPQSKGRLSGIAVAVNDEVVRRQAWEATPIREGDRIEIVTAKQGG